MLDDYCFVQKVLGRCINTFGHGGGIIKRHSACALLLVLGIVMCIFPSVGGAADPNASDDSAKIGPSEDIKPVTVNAAYKKVKVKVKVKYKSWYKSWYKSHGKWKYKWKYTWKYKYVYRYKTVKAASTTTKTTYTSSSSGFKSDAKIDSIMRSGAKYGYSRGISTASAMVKAGAGDCWAMSAYLNSKFQAAGYQSRIIQYATKYSSRHRSVQLYQNGKWITVPYRAYGYNSMFV
ncbi:hypothetical protein [Methanobacterium oryzae]|uniref:hypothetical protein n=1 Tax=Methanobacterium oryzae TaxID=69540 RepID=UPI003D1F4930